MSPSPSKLKIPMSPAQRLGHIATSPVRLVKRQVRPGSVNQSVFSLIIICLGAGTITIPSVYYENGLILGTVFIFFGGGLSLYTGYLISYCAEKTGGSSYEEIANNLYGNPGLRFTGFCNILCNVGFLISYIALFKTLMPYTVENLGVESLPDWLGQKSTTGNKTGEIVWATIFCFGLLFPISLPRSLVALRFTSLLSFAISIFIVMVIFTLSFRETKADGYQKHDYDERVQTAYDNSFDITV